MPKSLPLQVDLKSNDIVEKLLSIGEAAAKMGVRTSALRYYDERGLVAPATRRSGRRFYGPSQLRKIALLQMLQRLEINLEVAAALFDPPSKGWRASVREQIDQVDTVLVRATVARAFLSHLLQCPAKHPTRDCETMLGILDDRVAGTPLEALANEHGLTIPEAATGKKPLKPKRG